MGWDNLNPELNLGLNLKRALFSVWQEYQGLGLLAGHGHGADLPRQIFLAALSPVVPINLLRWSWVMGMLAAGTFGVYALLRTKVRPAGALLGALFALTNLGTLQIFYTPFEPFVTQFGTAPWLLLTFLLSVRTNKRGWFLALAITSIVAAPQGFVQTVFFASLLLLAILSVFLIVEGHQNMSTRIKRVFASWSIVLAVNAFWLLPSAYFITTGSRVTVEAKINQMSTEEVYLRNRAFGSLWDTVQLKGFWFDTFDFDPGKSGIAPIYGFWRAYAGHPVVEGAILILFAVILIGAVALIAKRKKQEYWLLGAFVVLVTLLTIDTSPLSWINDWLSRLPLFHQAYRIRFTKIASLASIVYSLLFGIGSSFLLEKAKRAQWRSVMVGGFLGVIAGSFALIGAPMVQGNLFYPVVVRSLPGAYTELFSYMQKKPADGRIAILPQPTYWGWKYYQWGYTGWGFLWYDIEQPILDQAFDPWSRENENYYWEISRSIYSKNAQSLLSVLTKYDVRYVLLDEHLISPSHNRALFTEEIKAMLAGIPEVREIAQFGKLTVYERSGASQSFISLSPSLPLVSPTYVWTDNDVAYGELGDYINQPGGYTYPFRSLFTKRSVDEREFAVSDIPIDALVYDSTKSADLVAENVKPCGVLREGETTAENLDQSLRFISRGGRACLSFALTNQVGPDTGLPHTEGYLVAVESRHVTGRPLMLSLINQTAKHTELETFFPTTHNSLLTASYFILPPLSDDGLGYNVYLTNDAIGRQETVNDLHAIRVYRIPYDELIHLRFASTQPQPQGRALSLKTVDHPNPAYYKIILRRNEGTNRKATLVLSQSFDPGWTAWEKISTFPYYRQLKNHVLVNNWANGWTLEGNEKNVVVFFWPQILEWIGFGLLPLPFVWIATRRKM